MRTRAELRGDPGIMDCVHPDPLLVHMPTEKRRSCTREDPGQRHRRVEERKHLCPLEFYRLESASSL